jgi:heat shock protein HslJ
MRAPVLMLAVCASSALCALAAPPVLAAPAPFPLPATFSGIEPCADCPGIRATLALTSATYTLTLHYLERNVADLTYTGPWSYVKSSSRIELKSKYGAPQFFEVVNPTTLRALDREGKRYASRAPNELTLLTLEPNQWLLFELRGMNVPASATSEQISLTFAAQNHVSGTDGCNRLTGTYKSGPNYALSFPPLASTRMMCTKGADIGDAFLKMLSKVSSYNFNGGTLNFYGGGWPLARFERVAATVLSH